jgi:CO dehydrogenase maturation factor
MKIAISGKGGVGKTTLAAVLARLYAEEGRRVLAVDADPDANLGLALGFDEQELRALVPIARMRELIAERTGASSEGLSRFFKINPSVSDIPDRFSREKHGVKLLVMGTVETGGAGCVCPEHVMLRRVISHLVTGRDDAVIMDMEAGLEHLGRGTAEAVDRFIVVTEPGARSLQTFHKIKSLAFDLGVKRVSVVANKLRGPEDEAFLKSRLPADALLGVIHCDDGVLRADMNGASPFDASESAVAEIRRIKERIDHSDNRPADEPPERKKGIDWHEAAF